MAAEETDPLAHILGLLTLDHTADVPPYEQVRQQLAAAVAEGRLSPGTRLPTVRGLAAGVGLAPNTVARSYRLLEADGVVETRGRRGTVVAGTGGGDATARRGAQEYAALARSAGLTRAQALMLVEEAWGGPRDEAG
jgi:DNA-binding transcriptional regulator YhcF (GntR family)